MGLPNIFLPLMLCIYRAVIVICFVEVVNVTDSWVRAIFVLIAIPLVGCRNETDEMRENQRFATEALFAIGKAEGRLRAVSYTHLRAHETL